MRPDPNARLDLEEGFTVLVGATKAVAVLAGEARHMALKPAQLEALLDLIAEKAETLAQKSGFALSV